MLIGDRQVVLLSAGVWLSAWLAGPSARWWGWLALIMVSALVLSRKERARNAVFVVVLVVVVVAAAHFRARQAWSNLVPANVGPVSGVATLASDPIGIPGGVRVRLDLHGDRLDAQAWGSPAGMLRSRLMGEQIAISGSVREIPITTWQASRGVVGRISVGEAGRWQTGGVLTRIANSVRRTIESGATSLDRDHRALLTGLVYGDDRLQSPLIDDDFRAAGLTHLLAVSGQNVAFVLVIFGPILRRLGFRSRFGVSLIVLLAFATLTRFEPSVLRASVMTGVAAMAVVVGRPSSSIRVISLSVAGLILWSPLIVHAVAFQLSVAASAGILFISPWLTPLIRGPRLFAEAVSVTAGAQLAVSPMLVLLFGSVPVASLPANVLAGPAAGPVMMWGLTAGWFAGLVGDPLATVVHVPTRLLIGWIAWIARLFGAAPTGELTALPLLMLAGVLLMVVWRPTAARRRVALLVVTAVLVAPGLVAVMRVPSTVAIDQESILWRDPSVTVLELHQSTDVSDLLTELRRAQVGTIDLIIVNRGGYGMFATLRLLEERYDIASVWAPAGHGLPNASAVEVVQHLTAQHFTLTIRVDDSGASPRLTVEEG